MNMKQRFRHFFGDMPKNMTTMLSERREYMPRGSSIANRKRPLPESVNNFLNMIHHQYRGKVLNWIATEGLRQLAKSRRKFCQLLQKQYGINIDQDELFSPMAYYSNPELRKLKDQIEQDWFDNGFEPRYIPIGGGSRFIDIAQINAHLANDGLEPLYFGGIEGLGEHYEQAKNWHSGFTHRDSLHDKQGDDLRLAKGHSGINSALLGKKSELEKLMKQAEAEGRWPDAVDLKDQINNLSKEIEKNMYKLGTGPIGFVPSTNQQIYDGAIDSSYRNSTRILNNLIKKLKAGEKFDDLNHPEWEFIQRLYQDGKISEIDDERKTLKEILGIQSKSDAMEENEFDKQHILYAKALIKARFINLLSTTPPKNGYLDTGKRSIALGNPLDWNRVEKTGSLPPATISLPHEAFLLADEEWNPENKTPATPVGYPDTPQDINRIADILTDAIIDDQYGPRVIDGKSIVNNIKVSRGSPQIGNQAPRFRASLDLTGFFTPDAAKILAAHPDIQVNYDGQPVSVRSEDVIKNMNDIPQTVFHFKQNMVNPTMVGRLIKIKPEDLDGYQEKKGKRNVSVFYMPNTNLKKKVARINGELYEYKPPTEMPINSELKNPNNNVELIGKGRFARIKKQNGSQLIARRSVDSEGNDVWYAVNPAELSVNTHPLLSPLSIRANTGLEGMKPQMRYDGPERTNKEFERLIDDWEFYGEEKPPNKNGIPNCILHAVAASRAKKDKKEAALGLAGAYLANMSGSVEFWYGDLKHKKIEDKDWITGKEKRRPRGSEAMHDIYDRLGTGEGSDLSPDECVGLSPNEVNFVVDKLADALFKNPATKPQLSGPGHNQRHKPGRRDITYHEGNELYIPPKVNSDGTQTMPSFRKDIFQAVMKNGYDWRVRRVLSQVNQEVNKDTQIDAKGQGGGDTDDAPDDQSNIDNDRKVNRSGKGGMSELEKLIQAQQADLDNDAGLEDLVYDDDDEQSDEYIDRGPRMSEKDLQRKELEDAGLNLQQVTVGSSEPDKNAKLANPQGVKRNVLGGYSAAIKDDDDKEVKLGRQRQSSDELNVAAKLPVSSGLGDIDDVADNPAPVSSGLGDIDDVADDPAPLQRPFAAPTVATNRPQPRNTHSDLTASVDKLFDHAHLKGYAQWLSENEAIHDPKVKIKDGCGFNWWGAAGDPLGVSISGKADTSKSDPTGKNKNGKSRTSGK